MKEYSPVDNIEKKARSSPTLHFALCFLTCAPAREPSCACSESAAAMDVAGLCIRTNHFATLLQDYPKMLVTAGLHDPRVAYWEPAKYVAKLRLNKTDSNMLLFKCDLGAGHFSQSGRFDALKELAIDYAFILLCHGKLRTGAVSGGQAQ
jgi:Prolyl oligopeptidase family